VAVTPGRDRRDDERMRPDPLTSITVRGGLAATHELAADGFGRAAVASQLRSGRMIRVRQGWYANAAIAPPVLRAARVGGRLSCVSALDLAGIWTHADASTHLVVDPHDCRLRSPRDSRRRRGVDDPIVVHWRRHPGPSRLIVDPIHALLDTCLCCSPEMVTASADSFLHLHPERLADFSQVAHHAPQSHQLALLRADGVCESGIETLFWLRMRHPAPRRQVRIRGVGRVDFLFGDRLVVEVDGAEFHSDAEHFETDRRRDALLSARGYRVLRFSYRQVMYDWPTVEAAVRVAISRGDRY
jgi:very-short-patch-repair endonuclease